MGSVMVFCVGLVVLLSPSQGEPADMLPMRFVAGMILMVISGPGVVRFLRDTRG